MATKEIFSGKPGYGELLVIFLKAGMAFGGGLGILAVLEDELVNRRQLLTKEEFLAIYALGRIVPSGTMTALAIAYGARFGGIPGTIIALAGLILPAFVITIALTVGYVALKDSAFFDLLPITILPAALAFIVAGAIRLGKDVFKPSLDLLLAVVAFIAAFVFNLNTAILLLLGGGLGIWLFGREETEPTKEASK